MTEINLPKIALGAWAWGSDGAHGSYSNYPDDKVAELEELADTLGINAIRFWEKVMD